MTSSEHTMDNSIESVIPPAPDHADAPARRASWGFFRLILRDSPYLAMMVLALLGAAYTAATRDPNTVYWSTLAPVYCVFCIVAGWRHTEEGWTAHSHLVWTQILHWVAFLIAMRVLYLPSVTGMLSTTATGLNVLTLLALGTFVAGLHVGSWRICVVGGFIALCVPAVAWLNESSLLIAMGGVLLVLITALSMWLWSREERPDHAAENN